MAIGVVVDTNIFVHANDENVHCHDACINVLTHLLHSDDDYINVDINFDFTQEARNNSPIGEEYWEHIPNGGIGEAMILQAIEDERIEFLDEPHWHIDKKIRVNYPKMKIPDRFFLKITYKSVNKILISEDFEDFSMKRRGEIKGLLGVRVLQSYDIFQPE